MIDLHIGEHAMLLEDPVDLFLIAPHHIPIIIVGLPPLPLHQGLNHAVFIICFEFDVARRVWVVLFFDVAPEVF